MSDPVDHALREAKLRKALPPKPRLLRMRHAGSGAEKLVEYLGMAGEPLRAMIHWPIAGQYDVSPRSGRIAGGAAAAERLGCWRVVDEDRAFLRQEYRLARARVPQRPKRAEGLAKCP